LALLGQKNNLLFVRHFFEEKKTNARGGGNNFLASDKKKLNRRLTFCGLILKRSYYLFQYNFEHLKTFSFCHEGQGGTKYHNVQL